MCSDQPPKIHSGVKAEWCRYPLSRSAKQTPGLHAFNKDLDILFFLVANILGTAAQCFSLQTNWLVCLSTHRSNITLFFFQLGGWSRRTARLSVFLVNSKPRKISDRSYDKVLSVQCLVPLLWRSARPPDFRKCSSLEDSHTLWIASWSRLLPLLT